MGGDEEDDEERQEVEEPGEAERGHGGRGGVARHGDAAGEGERAGVVAEEEGREEGVGRRVARAHPRGPEPCFPARVGWSVGRLRFWLSALLLDDRSLLCERAHGGIRSDDARLLEIRSLPRARWLGWVRCRASIFGCT